MDILGNKDEISNVTEAINKPIKSLDEIQEKIKQVK